MTRLDDQLVSPPAVREEPSEPRAATPSGPMAAWAWNVALALLAIWPTVALIRAAKSPEFAPSIANLVVVFAALVLIALAVVAAQPRERRPIWPWPLSRASAFFVGDLLLSWNQRGLRSIAETFLVRPAAQRQAQVGGLLSPSARDRLPLVDRRSDEDLREVLAHYKKHPPRIANVSLLLPAIEAGLLPRFLPLSWPADAILSGCNEGDQRQYPIFRTDRFGFNNEDWVYLWNREKAMLVGDSFAAGLCVHQEQSVQGVMRRSGLAAFSTGIGGHGPLLSLAALTEYGSALKPRSVFWLYFDGNDIIDLRDRELTSSFLVQYLNDRFTQRLAERQGEVDRYWDGFAEDGWVRLAQIQEQVRGRARGSTPGRQSRHGAARAEPADLTSLTADADVLRVFKAILSAAERRVRLGGDLYFVMIPNQDDYRGRFHPIGGLCSIWFSKSACRSSISIGRFARRAMRCSSIPCVPPGATSTRRATGFSPIA
jgi:hypothetical protein